MMKRPGKESSKSIENLQAGNKVKKASKDSNGRSDIKHLKRENIALQKAIEKNTSELVSKKRELEIEAALDSVRSRALSMHESSELREVVTVLFQKLQELEFGIDKGAALVMTFSPDSKDHTQWITDAKQSYAIPFFIPFTDHSIARDQFNARRKKLPFLNKVYQQKDKNEYFKYLFKQTEYNHIAKDVQNLILKSKRFGVSIAFEEHSAIAIPSTIGKLVSRNEITILKRFSKVFEQCYTRFLDLQKAETQAREAEIQLALERVRARTMAMQKSEELAETATVLFQQVKALGIESYTSGFTIWENNDTELVSWTSNADGSINPPFHMPALENKWHRRQFQSWRDKEEYVIGDFSDNDMQDYYAYLRSFPLLNEAFKKSEASGVATPLRQVHNVFNFVHGNLLFITLKPVPESYNIFKRFAKTFEQSYTRFLDLQKAEAQAREAQIQLALERVRARTMSMQSSTELAEVSFLLNKQVVALGIPTRGCAFNIYGKKDSTEWFSNLEGTLPAYKTPREKIFLKYYEAGQRGEALLIEEFDKKRIKQHYDYLHSLHLLGHDDDVVEKIRSAMPNSQIDHVAYFKYGYLLFITLAPAPEAHDVFKRFAKEFEQTYTRFLDLQKAEAQARESQIEAALEKVRSRTMGMQHSSELIEASDLLFQQVRDLGVPAFSCGYNIFENGAKECTAWMSDPSGGGMNPVYHIPLTEDANFIRFEESKRNREEFYVLEMRGERMQEHYRYLRKIDPEFDKTFYQLEQAGLTPPDTQIHHLANFDHGNVMFITLEPCPEAHDIFRRFAKVFEQTYTRFLDLQKAEAQTREAQIEAAWEKVRSRSLAMHKADELKEVASLLRSEMGLLGVEELETSSIYIFDEKDVYVECWYAIKDVRNSNGKLIADHMILNLNATDVGKKMLSFYHSDEQQTSIVMQGENRKEWINYCATKSTLLQGYYGNEIPERTYHLLKFSNGYVGAASPGTISDESWNLLQRVTSVFSFAYTRFLDLQKAEAQAREAQIEAALEKVRSRTMAMQKSDELSGTAAVLFQQLIALGIAPNRLFIILTEEDNPKMEAWLTDEDGSKVNMGFTGNYQKNQSLQKMYEGWRQLKKSLVIDMQGEELQDYFHYLHDELKVPFKGGLEQKRRIQHLAYFSHGMIGMASPEEQPAETLQLMERFASVFNLTFTRFNDLKIAEAHALQAEKDLIAIKEAKQKAEIALSELQATQKQLIQAEKMASLGELTAGIAHEIQNPLNFVNNFSEVSNELIDEMNIELEKGDIEEARAIAKDVKQNLEKINHHGKRADAIVKGMLQHSRSSSGQKELTDMNALCDEYLRLSYHGLRAKDKTFNAKFETHLDPTLPKMNVVPQDIGRVILNLINNAFYAVSEKLKVESKKSDSGYEPTVTVSTKHLGEKIEISVKDNGNGIPENIKDKIFQPFFTTKPTGQGTGLGLSLSYDIVKAHGGELKVETKMGEQTKFIIGLTIQNS